MSGLWSFFPYVFYCHAYHEIDLPLGKLVLALEYPAAGEFLATIGKINRELGTTILLTEHRLEETFPLATRVVVMLSAYAAGAARYARSHGEPAVDEVHAEQPLYAEVSEKRVQRQGYYLRTGK